MDENRNPAGQGGASEGSLAAKQIAQEIKTADPSSQAAFHPLANVFSLIEGEEFDELVADIMANGLVEPIVLLDNMILDGRNRYRACVAAGVEPSYRSFQGDDPAAFVISANIRRRHLNSQQRRELITKLVKTAPEKSDRHIAKAAGADHKTVGAVRADVEGRGEIPHIEARTDTKGRKQPARKSRSIERQEHHRDPKRSSIRADKSETEAIENREAIAAAAVRGFLCRAKEARQNATCDNLQGVEITEAVIEAADEAAAAWSVAAQRLGGAAGQNPMIAAWDEATCTQRHEFVLARQLEVMRAQQQVGPAAHSQTCPPVSGPSDPFAIPPFLDRTGSA